MTLLAYPVGDTVVAPASSPGRGAIGLVRLSGPQAWEIACRLVPALPADAQSQHAYVAELQIAGISDRCVATYWRGPHSYSGEDIAELSVHGNPLLLDAVVEQCVAAGARLAEPGEFSYRAFLNSKLDLVQAEAVQELIAAGSHQALKLAAAAVAGLPSQRLRDWVQRLNALLAGTEVIHDYAADDLDASLDKATLLSCEKVSELLDPVCDEMRRALEASRRSAPLRSGITVAICGPPNVGKSTLFNALLGHERSITAPEPGTTRDYITESLHSSGLQLTLVDTAGYRDAADAIEAAGVRRSGEWARAADIVLWVNAADSQGAAVPDDLPPGTLQVQTRADLLAQWPGESEADAGLVYVSGLTGQGLDVLRARLQAQSGELDGETLASFNQRQAQQIKSALRFLEDAVQALDIGVPLDAACMDIYAARDALYGIYEQPSRSEIVNLIFSNFCVGK